MERDSCGDVDGYIEMKGGSGQFSPEVYAQTSLDYIRPLRHSHSHTDSQFHV